MLIGEVMNGIRYKVENVLISECSNGGLDTTLAAMIAELVHKDIQMMANEYMTNKIAGLSEELEITKKELAHGTDDKTSDREGTGSPTSQSVDDPDSGTTDSEQAEA